MLLFPYFFLPLLSLLLLFVTSFLLSLCFCSLLSFVSSLFTFFSLGYFTYFVVLLFFFVPLFLFLLSFTTFFLCVFSCCPPLHSSLVLSFYFFPSFVSLVLPSFTSFFLCFRCLVIYIPPPPHTCTLTPATSHLRLVPVGGVAIHLPLVRQVRECGLLRRAGVRARTDRWGINANS